MKRYFSRLAAALVAGLALSLRSSHAQIPPPPGPPPAPPAGASLRIAPAAGPVTAGITVNDPSNHVWVIQTSPNLASWTDLTELKVYNGNYRMSFVHQPGTPSYFYRAIFDPSRQNLFDTTAAALLLPSAPFNYANPALPPYLLAPAITIQDNTPANNPITDAGATLGRVLFYDKRLSTNQSISCASCHQQQHGFADPRRFSVGYNGSVGTRNAMSLTDARYYGRKHFFWDERAATLEDQVLGPIQNPIEMGMTLPTLVARLNAEPYYTNLFALAFGGPTVTTNGISRALAQFVRSINSTNSKYDQGIPVGFANFTPQENLGRQLFFGQTGRATCSKCHNTDVFAAANIFNNGLEFPYVDKGVGGITGQAQDMGLFKVPSLRNVELSAPYMHDGRFATLDQVVDFYDHGVVDNPNLSPPLRSPPGPPPGPGQPPGPPPGSPLRLNLSPVEKAALVAFLKTLTDPSLASDPKLSDPFNYGN